MLAALPISRIGLEAPRGVSPGALRLYDDVGSPPGVGRPLQYTELFPDAFLWCENFFLVREGGAPRRGDLQEKEFLQWVSGFIFR